MYRHFSEIIIKSIRISKAQIPKTIICLIFHRSCQCHHSFSSDPPLVNPSLRPSFLPHQNVREGPALFITPIHLIDTSNMTTDIYFTSVKSTPFHKYTRLGTFPQHVFSQFALYFVISILSFMTIPSDCSPILCTNLIFFIRSSRNMLH